MADNEDIDFGQMSEALNDKADRDFKNIEEDASVPYHIEQMEEEVENRIAGDNALQEQIDAIVSKQELADIVGTYADLQAYDKSKLQNNAIIEVLQDETHDNAVSYYKFNSSSQSFSYIGSTAATYTKQESDSKYVKLTGAETIEGTKTFNTTPIVGTATSGDNSTKAASTAFVQTAISTAGNNYVHLSGDEIVNGTKTFNNVIKRSSNIDMTSTSGEVEVQSFTVYDKTGSSGVGMYNTTRSSTTNTNRQRVNNRNIADTGYWYDLRANLRDDGHGFVSTAKGSNVIDDSTTYVTNSTGTAIIPTMGWVNNPETSTNVVHRSGNETISGEKKFTSTPQTNLTTSDESAQYNDGYKIVDTSLDITTNPSYNKTYYWAVKDSSNRYLGWVGSTYYTTGQSTTTLSARTRNTDNTDYVSASINVSIKRDGTQSTFAPTPSEDTTTSTQIDTVGARNTKLASYALDSNVVHTTGNESISGTKTFNDNIITLGYIKGTTETGSAITNHAIALGHSNVNHMDFFEYGGVFNFYKSRSGTNTLLLKLNDTTTSVIAPTEDTTTSTQIDTVGARNTKLENYQPTLVSGTNIKTINNNSVLGSGNITIDSLPSQSGQSGKYLTTNGTSASWAAITIPQYTSGTGISINGTVINHSNSITAGTAGTSSATSGSSLDIPYITYDAQGHITASGTHTHTVTGFLTSSDIDQTYSGTSTNAQSGKAVKSAIDTAISSVYKPAGSVAFANIPSLSSSIEGNVYNITDAFTTTSDFVEGAGHSYPAGTNIVCINTSGTTYKWDVLAGFIDLSGYQTLISSTNKLSSDLVDDTNKTNKFVTAAEKSNWNNKVTSNTAITGGTATKITYDSKGLVTAGSSLSASDIPDISSTYQTKLSSSNKLNADYISDGTTNKTVTDTEKSTWSGKQDELVSGTNIKTINNTSLLGSGNIDTHELPSQAGQNGKFLTTNGTSVSWGYFDDTNYVTLDGTQSITGSKTFTSEIKRTSALSGGANYAWILTDTNSKGSLGSIGYYTGSQIYNRIMTTNSTSGKNAYIDIISADGGHAVFQMGGSASNNNMLADNSTSSTKIAAVGWVNDPTKSTNVVHRSGTETITGDKSFTGTVTAITQASTDNSTKVATTAFVQSVAGGGVTITYDSINKKLIFGE